MGTFVLSALNIEALLRSVKHVSFPEQEKSTAWVHMGSVPYVHISSSHAH
jgi:hypothetical protein